MATPPQAHQRLHQLVVERPDDDAPRLAYAEWCQQNGRADRARFIRVQCQLAGLTRPDARRAALESEQRTLLSRNEEAWLAGRPQKQGLRWGFLRGFPEWVLVNSVTALEACADDVFRHPVRRLSFEQVRSVGRLATCAALEQVAELDLGNCRIDADGLALVLASPHLGELTWLDLRGCPGLGPAGARLLAGCAKLRQLRFLGLDRCQIGPAGLEALVRSPHLQALTELALVGNGLTPDGLACLADAACWPGLRSLTLKENQLGDEGAQRLAQAPGWPALEGLDLAQNQVGDGGAAALAGAGWLGRLEALDLTGNAVGNAGAAALARSAVLPALHSLRLGRNLIGEAGALALGRAATLTGLRVLDLTGNAVRPAVRQAVEGRFRDQDPGRVDAALAAPPPAPAAQLPPPLPRDRGPADENALLQAILDDPDDDVPRLVYADYLEETGHPERAELLRLQCGRSAGRSTPHEQYLVGASAARVREALGDFSALVDDVSFARGLPVARVSMRKFLSRAFQEQAAEAFRRAGVDALMLVGTTIQWAKVADSPVFAAVHELMLNDTRQAVSDGLAGLLSSPHLAGLHTLRVRKGYLRTFGVLTSSPHLGRLRRLEIADNWDYRFRETLGLLADWPQADRLTSLRLTASGVRADGVSMLLTSPRLAGLVELDLSSNFMGNEGLCVLGGCQHLAGLRRLSLTMNDIGADGVRALTASPHLRGLHELYLDYNGIKDDGALLLAEWAAEVGLRRLSLSRYRLSADCASRIRSLLGPERLGSWW
jgi:uncharacterized protein (TIGR02996 family)